MSRRILHRAPEAVVAVGRTMGRGSAVPGAVWFVKALTLTVLMIAASGCSLFYQEPTVRIADVRLAGVGLSSGTAEIEFEVENPNIFALEVRRLSYLLEVEGRGDRWSPLAEGVTAESIRLPRRSTEEVTIQVPFRYEAVGVALRSWWETGDLSYRLRGDIETRGPLGSVELPFRAEGRMRP